MLILDPPHHHVPHPSIVSQLQQPMALHSPHHQWPFGLEPTSHSRHNTKLYLSCCHSTPSFQNSLFQITHLYKKHHQSSKGLLATAEVCVPGPNSWICRSCKYLDSGVCLGLFVWCNKIIAILVIFLKCFWRMLCRRPRSSRLSYGISYWRTRILSGMTLTMLLKFVQRYIFYLKTKMLMNFVHGSFFFFLIALCFGLGGREANWIVLTFIVQYSWIFSCIDFCKIRFCSFQRFTSLRVFSLLPYCVYIGGIWDELSSGWFVISMNDYLWNIWFEPWMFQGKSLKCFQFFYGVQIKLVFADTNCSNHLLCWLADLINQWINRDMLSKVLLHHYLLDKTFRRAFSFHHF